MKRIRDDLRCPSCHESHIMEKMRNFYHCDECGWWGGDAERRSRNWSRTWTMSEPPDEVAKNDRLRGHEFTAVAKLCSHDDEAIFYHENRRQFFCALCHDDNELY